MPIPNPSPEPKARTRFWPASPASPNAPQSCKPLNLCHEPLLQDTRCFYLTPFAQQVRPPAQILGGDLIAVNVFDCVAGYGAADSQGDLFALLLQEFLQQECQAKPGVQRAHELETQAVLSAEKNRQGSGASLADQSRRRFIPARIGNRALRHLPMRHLARGENGEHPALV